MGIFREIPPTAGFPVPLGRLFRAAVLRGGSLEEALRGYLGAPYCRITPSGTAGLYFVLEAMKELSGRSRVIIPSYTCPSVALAVRRAGLKPELCDVMPGSLELDLAMLEKKSGPDTLAVVVCHLAGMPSDAAACRAIAAKAGALLIEDCAQALGARRGSLTGSCGDCAVFSFARGKGLTMYEGGAVTCRKPELALAVEDVFTRFCGGSPATEALRIAELAGYSVFYRPALFWLVYRLPQWFWRVKDEELRSEAEYYEEAFPLHKVSRLRESCVYLGLATIGEEISRQRRKAAEYARRLEGIRGVRIVEEPAGARAVFPFVMLLFDEPGRKRAAMGMLSGTGLGVSELYRRAVNGYPYLGMPEGDSANAADLAGRQMTLSTSCFIRDDEIAEIARRLKKL